MHAEAADPPLAGLRIVDGVSGPLAAITRYLAELGANVDRVAESSPDAFEAAAANHGKQLSGFNIGDLPAAALLAKAHIIVVDADAPVDLASLRNDNPSLVTMAVSGFGTDTSLTGWQATDPVLHALSGELSRSGIKGCAPLLPPGQLAMQCAAAQAAYLLVTGAYAALRTGEGTHYDFSALDGAVQALDPGFGISGSATMGKPAHMLATDRPPRGFQYPIFPCADGHVRICLLAKRQWQGMFRWMGEPKEFASPEFEKGAVRYKSPDLLPALAAFFADKTRADLERDGQTHGVPISGLRSFEECIGADHLRERGAFIDAATWEGARISLPNGVITIDGARMGPGVAKRDRAFAAPVAQRDTGGPFAGLRVLDLGVIVVGAEQGRLLADGGADVVKVESLANPDGNRQSYLSYGMSVSFAAGHRNKRSLGINLRDTKGRELFLRLAATADVILSNFKPGTMDSLGLGREALRAANPRAVLVESSAFGDSGPWSKRMGYGPLVRAATGLTELWRYPSDPGSFSDSVTIYPDHVAARIGAIAAAALLIRRLRTGHGGVASIAQAEVMLSHFASDVARASAGMAPEKAPDWPWSVYRAAGEDDWCVITVRGGDDWARLAQVISIPDSEALVKPADRLAAREPIDAAIETWLGSRSADAAMRQLQAAGVPAARMLRLRDLPNFEYFADRGFYRVETHPYLQEDVIAERWSGKCIDGSEAPQRPAPLAGEHTAEVVKEWLGAAPELEEWVDRGVLEPLVEETYAAALGGAREAHGSRASA